MYRRLAARAAAVLIAVVTSYAQTVQVLHPFQSEPSPAVGLSADAAASHAGAESWTELSLSRSGLPPGFNAVLMGKWVESDYVRESWRVQWRPADPIDLFIVLPKGVTRPPVTLYLYDYHFDTDRFRSDVWCKGATEGGLAAVGFSSALSLQRQHAPRPMKEWFVSELQEALSTSTHDVQKVLDYLASRGDLDVSHVAMYGQGSGGAIAILAAAVDPRIQVLDLLNPWGDWPDWLKDSQQVPDDERPAYLQPAFLQKVSGMDPVSYLPHLKVKALRIQMIMDDLVTPPSARDKIAAAAPRPEDVVRYADAAQHFSAWSRDGLNGWIVQQLVPASERASRNPE